MCSCKKTCLLVKSCAYTLSTQARALSKLSADEFLIIWIFPFHGGQSSSQSFHALQIFPTLQNHAFTSIFLGLCLLTFKWGISNVLWNLLLLVNNEVKVSSRNCITAIFQDAVIWMLRGYMQVTRGWLDLECFCKQQDAAKSRGSVCTYIFLNLRLSKKQFTD